MNAMALHTVAAVMLGTGFMLLTATAIALGIIKLIKLGVDWYLYR